MSKRLELRRNRGDRPQLSFAPIFKYAAQTGFFFYVEDPENRENIARGYPDFHIVREHEEIESTGRVTGKIGYDVDGKGGCSVITREYSDDLRQSGVRGRGDQRGLLPQIVFRKYSETTGKPISGDDDHRRTGEWKAFAIVLPLERPVTPIVAADSTLPVPNALFYDNTNTEERGIIKQALRNRSRQSAR